MKRAACILVLNEKNEILAVSRKHDPGDLGLPGGKCDEGESFVDCASREAYEETGYKIHAVKLVHSGEDSLGYMVQTYLGEILTSERASVKEEETGHVVWTTWDYLCSDRCSFKDYNKVVMEEFQKTSK